MPHFHYKALGAQQLSASGEITAPTVRDAIEQLEARGLEVLSIEQLDPVSGDGTQSTLSVASSLRPPFEKLFAHHLSLAPALAAYCEELSTHRVRREVQRIIELLYADDIDGAVRSFDALADHWTPLLSAAATHSHSQLILAEYLRRSPQPQQPRQFAWSPYVYPVVLLVLAASIMVAMSMMLVPTFRDIFTEFNLELPEATKFILTVAAAIDSGRVYYGLLAAVLVLLIVWILVRQLPASARATISRWTLWRRRRLYLNGRLANYVADLLQAGLSRRDSLWQAAMAVSHPAVAASATDLAGRLHTANAKGGHRAQSSLTHTVVLAMSAEMSNESRIQLLRELSHDYDDQSTRYLPWKQQLLLGPITLVVVGFTVGFTVLALFLPLVRLIEGLS